jgi:dihydroorotase
MLISGGRVVDPVQGLDALRDLRIQNGRVSEIAEHLAPREGERTIDARNAVVAPGFIDMHVHLREPGFEHKETVASGTAAALRGGFTAVACMPNTNPPLDDPQRLRDLMRRIAAGARCRVYPVGAITRGRSGTQPCDYAALAAAGAVAFSDDGDAVADAGVLRDAALLARNVSGAFLSHCEDPALKRDGAMHLGTTADDLGIAGAPALAEESFVARDLLIAADTAKAWHIAHLTTALGLQLIRAARAHGSTATCEVTPHHLTFSDDAVRELGPAAKVNPPLRDADDVRALRAGVRDGTVDALATDHAPHTVEEKSAPFAQAAVGFTGLEIAIGAYAAALPDLPLPRFIELLSANPARILGVEGGTLAVGSPADVTIFADRAWRVDPSRFASKGTVTPFAGHTLPRRAIATIVGGDVRFFEP